MSIDESLIQIGNDNRPIEMVTSPARLFILISQLQLALRHPENTGSSATIARQMAENMAKTLCSIYPQARELIEQGWDSTHDVSRDQFEVIREGGEEIQTQIRLANASNLLIEAARQAGRPLILAANAGMHHEEGVQDGNPAAIDLERIRGLSFAIVCDQFEAQFLINGINTLLGALSRTIALVEDLGDEEG